MPNFTKVFLSQPRESSAVGVRGTTDELIRMRMKLLAFVVTPCLFSVVFRLEVYGARAPVVLLTRNVIAALKEKDLLARGREAVGQRASARARADDDYVVVIIAGHGGLR